MLQMLHLLQGCKTPIVNNLHKTTIIKRVMYYSKLYTYYIDNKCNKCNTYNNSKVRGNFK